MNWSTLLAKQRSAALSTTSVLEDQLSSVRSRNLDRAKELAEDMKRRNAHVLTSTRRFFLDRTTVLMPDGVRYIGRSSETAHEGAE